VNDDMLRERTSGGTDPGEPSAAHRHAARTRLDEVMAAATVRRGTGRPKAAHRVAIVGVLGVAVAGAALGLTTPWSSDPGLIERAAAAVSADTGEILHYRVSVSGSERNQASLEIWAMSTPGDGVRLRQRTLEADGQLNADVGMDLGESKAGVLPDSIGTTTSKREGTAVWYHPNTGSLSKEGVVVYSGVSPLGSVVDPRLVVEAALVDGDLRDTGVEVRLDGRAARQLRAVESGAFGDQSITYYVDPEKGTPIRAEISASGVGPAKDRILSFDFSLFEELPANTVEAGVFDVASQYPNARK
jgi:hypothetical protein